MMMAMRFLAAYLSLALLGCSSPPTCEERLAEGPPHAGEIHGSVHRAALLEQGFDALVQRIALVRRARATLDLQTFIWADDASGRYMLSECLAAARRGVRVRLLVDGLFCTLDGSLIAAAAASTEKLEFHWYNPKAGDLRPEARETHPAIYLSLGRINQRMHTKLMIVDGRHAITGGRNIEDTYFDVHAGLNFLDRDVLIEGSVTDDIQDSFDDFWSHELSIPSEHLTPTVSPKAGNEDIDERLESGDVARLRAGVEARLPAMSPWVGEPVEVTRVYYHADPPGKPGRDDGLVTTSAIHYYLCAATESMHLQSPYFVTTRSAKTFLDRNDRLETPRAILVHTNSLAATDNWATYAAYQREKRHLIEHPSLELHEIKPRPEDLDELWSMDPTAVQLRARGGKGKAYLCLHAKSMVLDRRIALVGSFNLDPRSAHINTEVMLEIDDLKIAGPLAASIERHMAARNSWVAARRQAPLGRLSINHRLARMSSGISRILALDVWPIENTTLYELRESEQPCRATDPEFSKRYRSVGPFPETGWDGKVLKTEVFRTTGAVFTPTL